MRTIGRAVLAVLLYGLTARAWDFRYGTLLNTQHPFFGSSAHQVPKAVPEGDPAGSPNIATRLEVTSPVNSTLFCASPGDKHISGYAHFTNSLGQEDKHMFWTLLEARNDPDNAPVILYFGGGPGSSGLAVPFSGQGPCNVIAGKDEKGEGVPSEYSWTEFAHILAIDQPVGTGFSYGDRSSFRNSSERAAWDVDDLLQAFWRKYPILAKNQFAIGSGSYGGTYVPNVVNVIRSRNLDAVADGNSSRILKMPDTAMITNPWSDPVSAARYFHVVACDDFGYFNETMCEAIVQATPACLDSMQLAEEQPTIQNRVQASETCARVARWEDDTSGKNPYDARLNCTMQEVMNCFPEVQWVEQIMNNTRLRDAFGVALDFPYQIVAWEDITIPFYMNGDLSQRAYKLLGPAVNDGMRLLVYSGIEDAVCAIRPTEAWLRLLSTKHQQEFRNAAEMDWPGVGSFYTVGAGGAGEYAFVKVKNAGHLVIAQQQQITQQLARKWLSNEKFV